MDAAQREKLVSDLVFSAIRDLNKQLPPNKRLDTDPASGLAGADGPLDSLGLVNLLVTTENKLEAAFGISPVLAEEAADAPDANFASVHSYIQFVERVVERSQNG